MPEIRYAHSGDVAIAYAVMGDGPIDLVYVHGFMGHLELELEHPLGQRFFERLASYTRVITFDRRGTGLSDRVREVPTLEARMDDLRAVMDDAGSERAVLFGTFEAASMSILFAASRPERVAALAAYNPIVKGASSPDFPWGQSSAELQERITIVRERWGTIEFARDVARAVAPSLARDDDDDDEEYVHWLARLMRSAASPSAAAAIRRMEGDVDVRDVLPSVRVPTLVFHSPWNREPGEYAVARIPGARRIELAGDTLVWTHGEALHAELERFAIESFGEPEPETVLATILFTDIVGSTDRLVELGDRRWAELVASHDALVRRDLDRFRGRELDTAGDGFFAAFDGPIRAIRCAAEILSSGRALGLEIRAGVHTGECERIGEKLGGIAVNIGARVAALAGPNEILVSGTVKDLVAGSGLSFEERGEHELKGVPGTWRLYAVADA